MSQDLCSQVSQFYIYFIVFKHLFSIPRFLIVKAHRGTFNKAKVGALQALRSSFYTFGAKSYPH